MLKIKKSQSNFGKSVTIKWKVALKNNKEEETILQEIQSKKEASELGLR